MSGAGGTRSLGPLAPYDQPGVMHDVGKPRFAQTMEFVPWKTFDRIVERHRGDVGVRTLGCANLFHVTVFAQLTWCESLRDIEACLAVNQTKLFHMGMKSPPAHSTRADALNLRD